MKLFKDSFRELISTHFDNTLFNETFKSSNNFLNSPHDSHKFKLYLFNTNDQVYAALIPENSPIKDVIHLDKTHPVPSNGAALVFLGYTLSKEYSLNNVCAELFQSNAQASFNFPRKNTEKNIPMHRLKAFNQSLAATYNITLMSKIEIATDVDFIQRDTQLPVDLQRGNIGSSIASKECLLLCSSEKTPSPEPNPLNSIPIKEDLPTESETLSI